MLSTRKCVATPVWARGAVDMWTMRRREKFGRMRMVGVPLDVGVGRGVRDLRNACIPQTNVILARAGFSLGGDEWESGARGISLARGRIAGQRDDSGAPQRDRTGRNSRDPHIHGAGRPAVIGLDHRAGRRAVLSTRQCVATPGRARGAVDMWVARVASLPGCSARSPLFARSRATG